MSETNNVDMNYLVDVEEELANPRTQVGTWSTQVGVITNAYVGATGRYVPRHHTTPLFSAWWL